MNQDQSAAIVILGAGMAGLTAAATLREAGREVLILDKGRGVGGRLSSRRIGDAVCDHGAQFATARDQRFADRLGQWRADGAAEEWFRGAEPGSEDHIRWRGKPAMNALAQRLAGGLDIMTATRVLAIERQNGGWALPLDSGQTVRAESLLVTAPVPQALALLAAGGVDLPPELHARLQKITYERCLAVMAVLEGPSRVPAPGCLTFDEGPLAWLADNQIKGVSPVPAVTIHASADFSLAHWDDDRQETARILIAAAASHLGVGVQEFQIHGWRYSKPVSVDPSPCLLLQQQPLLAIAGDAFAGPRVEGAALSGWAAAAIFAR